MLDKITNKLTNFLKKLDYRYYIGIFVVGILIVGGVIYILRAPKSAEAEWFNDAWYYRKSVDISNSGSEVDNQYVKITLDTATLISASKMQSNCNDLRVTDINGNVLDYFIDGDSDYTCNDSDTSIYVMAPNIPTDGATLYIYYGNPVAENREVVLGTESKPALSCKTILEHGDSNGDGNYYITPSGNLSDLEQVYCDMTNNDGGWMLVEFDMLDSVYTAYMTTSSSTNSNQGINYNFISTDRGCGGGRGDPRATIKISNDYEWDQVKSKKIMGPNGTSSCWGVDGASYTVQTNLYQYSAVDGDIIQDCYLTCDQSQFDIPPSVSHCDSDPDNFARYNGSESRYFTQISRRINRTTVSGPGVGLDCNTIGLDWSVEDIYIREYNMLLSDFSSSNNSEEKGPGPVGYWSFDEGYGTTAYDRTSNGNDGSITGATWQTEDKCVAGKCLYFDGLGSDNWVDLGNSSELNPDNFTISLWAKRSAESDYRGSIISSARDCCGTYNGIDLRFDGSMRLYAGIWDSSIYVTNSSVILDANEWVYITWTYDGTISKIYQNGKQVGSLNYSGGVGDPASYNLYIGRMAAYSNYVFKGFIDEVKIYPYARTEAQIKSDYNAGLAGVSFNSGINVSMGGQSQKSLSDGLIGYWKMDESSGNAVDSSGNGNDGAWNGTGSHYVTGKFGNGGGFNGSDDKISFTENNPIGTAEDGFTLSSWVKIDAGTSDQIIYFANIQFRGNIFYTRTSEGFQGIPFTHLGYDVWQHFVGTFDGENMKFYVNGTLVGEKVISLDIFDPSTFKIGGRYDELEDFDGSIDEVRIYNRALSADEIKQLYEYAPGPVGYWDFEENLGTTVYDKSGNENNGTLTSMDASTDWVLGKYGSGLDFDGNGDHVKVIDDTSINPTGAITLEAWFNTSDITATAQRMISKTEGSGYQLSLNENSACPSNALCFLAHIGGAYRSASYASSNLVSDHWYHAVGTFDGVNGKLYLDGILVGTFTQSGTISTNSSSLCIGTEASGVNCTTGNFVGKLDEVKIYDYARTQKQILEDMNGGRPASKSPVGYWKFDEGYGTTVKDYGLGGNDGTITGATWTNNGKVGKALSFDGDDVVDTSLSVDIDNDFTFLAWVKKTSDTSRNTIIGNWQPWIWHIYNKEVQFETYINNVESHVSANTNVEYNEWTHLAVEYIYSEDKVKFYNNGVFDGESILADKLDSVTETVHIGGYPAWKFHGIIDEAKIFNYALSEDEVKQEFNQGKAIVIGSTKNSDSTWDDGGFGGDPPVAYWNFEEGSGTTANDTSGNGNTGILNTMDNSDWVLGKESSWALDFDGSSDYIDVGQIDLDHTEPLSISVWVNVPSPIPTNPMIFGKTSDSGSYRGFHFNVGTDGKLAAGYFETHTPSSIRTSAKTQASIDTDRWTHIELTYDGSNDYTGFNFYIDGILQDKTDEDSGSVTNSTTSNNAYIGARAWGTGNNFLGKIDEFKIYDYVRTPAQVAWDYNGGKPVGHWRLDDGEGITANDASGNGNNGTLTNMDPATDWLDGSDCKFEGCLDFDGSDDHVEVPNVLTGESEFFVSAWVKTSGGFEGSYGVILGSIDSNWSAGDFMLFIRSTGKLVGYVKDNIVASRYAEESTLPSIFDNEWHYVGFGSNGDYLFSVLDGDVFVGDSISLDSLGSGTTRIGRKGNSNDCEYYDFRGIIDDVRLYNYALSADQIKEIYNGGLMRFK